MKYRTNIKTGDNISLLGFGCMRFAKDANDEIDLELTYQQIKYAIDNGVNYIDTAYVYKGSEVAVGKILARDNLRSRVLLATKLPRWEIKTNSDFDKYFNEEIARLQTNYFDYYLLHCFDNFNDYKKLVDLGVKDWIKNLKQQGKIRRIGFSFHGNYGDFVKIVDDYDWDFTQLQYNILDVETQAGLKGLDYCLSKGLGVIVMEPLQGGNIVNKLPMEARQYFDKLNQLDGTQRSDANLALNFAANHKAVFTVLSGMNSMQQVKDNIQAMDDSCDITERQAQLYFDLRQAARGSQQVKCTDCRYCQPCPQGIVIPQVFAKYNEYFIEKDDKTKAQILQQLQTTDELDASKCVKCGNCERHCPQAIKIIDWLSKIAIIK